MRLTGGRACWRERGHSYRSICSYRKLPPRACPGTTCIYFYDAWRTQPVLGAPESDLVLPPYPGLLTQGCYWPQRDAEDEVLSVSDIATEADAQACQTPTSPETADAVMTDEEANDIVSVLSSSTEPSTLPSTVHQEEADSPMGDKDAEANPSDEAGDCLSNRPASSSTRPVNNEMLEENGEFFFCTGMGAMCAERHKSPSRIQIGGT